MSNTIRLNKYNQLYLGPVGPRSTASLRVKSMNDRTALQYMRAPPSIYHVSNFQSTAPRSYHMPVLRHSAPLHLIPEFRGGTRHVRGGAKYNQEVNQRITELSKLVR